VVEDDPAVRTFVVEALSALGYRVAEAADAGSALETLDSGRRISLLFSDVILADGMNGVELARQVRRRWPEVKLLLTTGFTESVGSDLADIGAHTEILYKPYRTTELRQSVARALAG
jgi:CheY-like chemotaxis protein